jgi:thioredoxin-like negative regulator of GroEL
MDTDSIGVTLTDQNFQTTVLESPQPMLVAFWAEGCGP